MGTKFVIRIAKSSDFESILNFIRENYYKEEPITISHPEIGHTFDDEAYTMSHLSHGTCLLAEDLLNGVIIGVLVSGPIEEGDADAMLENSKTSTKKWSDIQKLLAYIEKKANVLKKFGSNRALHCHVLSVHQKHRGNGIGKELFVHWCLVGRNFGYDLLSVDCTSIYSIRIAERMDFTCVSTVTYDEYNAILGEKLFTPKDPNYNIKTFIKQL